MMSQMFDEKVAAERLGVAVQTLRNWRFQRKGPAYLKLGRAVRYREDDLNDFENRNRIVPEEILA
jgi:hypothetical protein